MPDAAAAEAAERKRVMEAVAHMLEAAVAESERGFTDRPLARAVTFSSIVRQAITELRTPVGREKNP